MAKMLSLRKHATKFYTFPCRSMNRCGLNFGALHLLAFLCCTPLEFLLFDLHDRIIDMYASSTQALGVWANDSVTGIPSVDAEVGYL